MADRRNNCGGPVRCRGHYPADSLAKNANASDAQYNRVPTTEEFEDIWKTGTPLSDNIYIMFPNNAD